MITPARINDISNEIATIYAHISDELLVNIGKHITSPNWTHTASWEIQKLAELGQLTQENAAIINKWIKAIPPELRNAMEETRKAALDEIEKQMDAAAKRGYTTPPVTDSTVEIFRDMQNQAANRLNLVNTTMLQSSVDQYQRAIVLTEDEYNRLMAQREATQEFLNDAAMSTATGVETRRVAVRRAIGRISAEGLTGFIDRAGRHWTPEAYVNMDVRTTVHNTAIQATRARMNDFGTSVFQVSSHAGARPLCYPYQGKFYSWDNTSGTIELGDGSVVSYEPINSTSYGQPAGVFGCNCGHYPIPIIAGITIPHGADNIQPEEENDAAYALSQEQRALERKIREAKRLVEMAGDSATPEDKQKVKDAQAQMREFIAKTGRTRRYDREQIGGTPQTKAPAVPKAPEPAYRDFGKSGAAANAFFGERPDRALRRENREEYDRQRELYNQSMFGSWYNNLTGEQVGAIAEYTGDSYSGINGLLRGQMTKKMVDAWNQTTSQPIAEMIRNIDSALASFELREPIRVYRTCDERMLERLSSKLGGVFKDDGFGSTSAISDKVASGNIVIQIDVPAGKNHGAWINPLSGAQDEEYEFLMPRGSEYKVERMYQRGEDTVFEMTFLGSEPSEIRYASREYVIERLKAAGVYDESAEARI